MKFPKNADLWFPAYVRDRVRHMASATKPKRLWVALTDHFEPYGNTDLANAHVRMSEWTKRWPGIAARAPKDAEGKAPVFTAFYPQEEYERELLNTITALTKDGTLDVEVHLHHFNDNAERFRAKVQEFTKRLREDHGLLHEYKGKPVFGFIHGNWALDNSHPTGHGCGVKGELQVLRDLGCYADFTMPSLPSPTQSRIVNRIYWTTGDPEKPRGFDSGVEATVGGGRRGDLLMITGPMGIRWPMGLKRAVPRLETGELSSYDRATPYRVQRWLDLAPRVGEDIFLKLYGHTAREDNAAAMLGTDTSPSGLAELFQWVHEAAAARGLELHWASAFDMFRAVDRLMQPEEAAAALATERTASC